MSKITGIGQLLLKLSLVVGWYPFFETQCMLSLIRETGQCTRDLTEPGSFTDET